MLTVSCLVPLADHCSALQTVTSATVVMAFIALIALIVATNVGSKVVKKRVVICVFLYVRNVVLAIAVNTCGGVASVTALFATIVETTVALICIMIGVANVVQSTSQDAASVVKNSQLPNPDLLTLTKLWCIVKEMNHWEIQKKEE